MNKELKVGLFTIAMVVVLYIGFNFLKGINALSDDNIYYATYDNVTGLLESNNVKIKGVPVGIVKKIQIQPEDNKKILVTLYINKDIEVREGAVALLTDDGLLGSKIIDLSPGTGNLLEEESYLTGKVQENMLTTLKQKADPMATSLQLIMDSLRHEMIPTYTQVGKDLQKTLAQASLLISQNQVNLQQSIEQLNGTMTTVNQRLPVLMDKLETLEDSLNQAPIAESVTLLRDDLQELNKTMQAINNADGTVGKLLNEDELHNEMVQTMKDLDLLLVDLQENPKRYVHFSLFGKKDKSDKKKKEKEASTAK